MRLFGWKKTAETLNKALEHQSRELLAEKRWRKWFEDHHETSCDVYKAHIKNLESVNKILDERNDALVTENEEIIAELEKLKEENEKLTAERDWLSGEVKWFREGGNENEVRNEVLIPSEPLAQLPLNIKGSHEAPSVRFAGSDIPVKFADNPIPRGSHVGEATWAGGMTGDDDELPPRLL